jgi:hypothetical protein
MKSKLKLRNAIIPVLTAVMMTTNASAAQSPSNEIEITQQNLINAENDYNQKSSALIVANEQLIQKSGTRPVYTIPVNEGQIAPPWAQQQFIEGIRDSNPATLTVPQAIANFHRELSDDAIRCFLNGPVTKELEEYALGYSKSLKDIISKAFAEDCVTTAFPFNAEYIAEVLSQLDILLMRMCVENHEEHGVDCSVRYGGGFSHPLNQMASGGRITVQSNDSDHAASVFIHELGHALGLGEALTTLLEVELSRNPLALNEITPYRYPGFDKVLLERAGAQKFWTAAFTSNEAYKTLWNDYMPEMTIDELVAARALEVFTGHSDDGCNERCGAEIPNDRHALKLGGVRPCYIPEEFLGIFQGDVELLEKFRTRLSERKNAAKEREGDNFNNWFRHAARGSQPVSNGTIYHDESTLEQGISAHERIYRMLQGSPQNTIDPRLLVEALECFNRRIDEFYSDKQTFVDNQQQAQVEYDKAKALVVQLRNKYEGLLAQQSIATAVTKTAATSVTTTVPTSATAEQFHDSFQDKSTSTSEQNPNTGVPNKPITTAGFVGGLLTMLGTVLLKQKEQGARKNPDKTT